MEQHPIPRQITTFEFKLIGFLTLKQFIYLVVFVPMGFLVYKTFPVPFLNILFGAIVAGIGLAFAFVPINDRPLDVWIKNLTKRAISPTQYLYHKQNAPIYFLHDLFFQSDPHRVLSHIESQRKLSSYLDKKNPGFPVNNNKQQIDELLKQKDVSMIQPRPSDKVVIKNQTMPKQTNSILKNGKAPFFTGVVKNHRLIPLPGILIYVKDEKENVIRLLKTNPHGVFATFSPLPGGNYLFEPKDPRSTYFFDTMKMDVSKLSGKPLEIFSKELL